MFVGHEGCFRLLCHGLGEPFDLTNLDTLVALLQHNEFLGITTYGGYEGIDYSEGKLDDRWLTQPYSDTDANLFAWDYANGEEDFVLKRYLSNIPMYLL